MVADADDFGQALQGSLGRGADALEKADMLVHMLILFLPPPVLPMQNTLYIRR